MNTLQKAKMNINQTKNIEYKESIQTNSLASALPENQVFDETSFDFQLMSQPNLLHTDVLIASATFKTGELQGTPVPLHCNWYNSENGDFVMIEGVTSSCY